MPYSNSSNQGALNDASNNQNNGSDQNNSVNVQGVQQQPQQEFRPYSAFPANIKRTYDQSIYNIIFDLVQSKYQPHAYLDRMRKLEAQGQIKLEEYVVQALENAGPDIDQIAFDFEIARVYNKLEIDIYERSTFNLPEDKKAELQRMSEEGQQKIMSGDTQAQQDLVLKINQFMQANVPGIQDLVRDYMEGFKNQYLAGRY